MFKTLSTKEFPLLDRLPVLGHGPLQMASLSWAFRILDDHLYTCAQQGEIPKLQPGAAGWFDKPPSFFYLGDRIHCPLMIEEVATRLRQAQHQGYAMRLYLPGTLLQDSRLDPGALDHLRVFRPRCNPDCGAEGLSDWSSKRCLHSSKQTTAAIQPSGLVTVPRRPAFGGGLIVGSLAG